MKPATLAALIVAVLAIGVVAWGVSELHYRNCVNAAKAQTPERAPGPVIDGVPLGDISSARKRAIRGCSRLPF